MSLGANRSLATTAVRGASVTMLAQLANFVIQIAAVVILARLLNPEDFGFLSMVTAIVGIGSLVRDLGLANAAIQAPNLTTQLRTNLFWITTAMGLAIAIIVFCLSPVISLFYSTPQLEPIVAVLSITFLLNGITTQYRASLSRGLKFRSLAIVDTVSPLLGLLVGVAVALWLHSYWALVAEQLAISIAGLVMVVVLGRWLPGRPRKAEGLRPIVSYGMNLLGSQLIAYVGRNVDTVTAGYRFGPVITGFYGRAFDLVMNPINQVSVPSTKVAIPILSRLQDDRARFDAYLVQGQRLMLMAIAPVLMMFVSVAEPIFELLLGPDWIPVAPLLQILSIGGLFRLLGYATYWFALSRGLTRISLYVNLTSVPLTIVCVLVGSIWGIAGIASGYSLAAILVWALALIWYGKVGGAPSVRLLRTGLIVVASVITPFAAGFATNLVTASLPTIVRIVLGILAFVLVYGIEIALVPRLREDFKGVFEAAKLLRSRRGGASPTRRVGPVRSQNTTRPHDEEVSTDEAVEAIVDAEGEIALEPELDALIDAEAVVEPVGIDESHPSARRD